MLHFRVQIITSVLDMLLSLTAVASYLGEDELGRLAAVERSCEAQTATRRAELLLQFRRRQETERIEREEWLRSLGDLWERGWD